jgi:hypothetical protein
MGAGTSGSLTASTISRDNLFEPAGIRYLRQEAQTWSPPRYPLSASPGQLASLLEQIIRAQQTTGQLGDDFESHFLTPVVHEVAKDFVRNNPSLAFIDVTRRTVGSIQNGDLQLQRPAPRFTRIGVRKAPTDTHFLEHIITAAFKAVLPAFDCADASQVLSQINYCARLLDGPARLAMSQIDSSVFEGLVDFAVAVTRCDRLQRVDIQIGAIGLLFDLGMVQANVTWSLCALMRILRLPPDMRDATRRLSFGFPARPPLGSTDIPLPTGSVIVDIARSSNGICGVLAGTNHDEGFFTWVGGKEPAPQLAMPVPFGSKVAAFLDGAVVLIGDNVRLVDRAATNVQEFKLAEFVAPEFPVRGIFATDDRIIFVQE